MFNFAKSSLICAGMVTAIIIGGAITAEDKKTDKQIDTKTEDEKTAKYKVIWGPRDDKAKGEIWVDDHGNQHRVWNGGVHKLSKEEQEKALQKIEKSLENVESQIAKLDDKSSDLEHHTLKMVKKSLVAAKERVKTGYLAEGYKFNLDSNYTVELAPVIGKAIVGALSDLKDQEFYLQRARVDIQAELGKAREEIIDAMAEIKEGHDKGGAIYEYKYRVLKDAHKSVEEMEKRELEELKRAEEHLKRTRERLEKKIADREAQKNKNADDKK